MTAQEFFTKYHYISLREIAKRSGINYSLLRQYTSDIKKPSTARLKQIVKTVREIGRELSKAE